MKLFEYKSVSDEVNKLVKFIGNKIITETNRDLKAKSSTTNGLFVENTFIVSVNNFLKNGNKLTVNYIMYYTETQREYNILTRNQYSEADEDTNTIRIISGFINGEISDDFYETIAHELNHLFHYGMGMEKRVDIYNKTKELLKLGRNDIDAYYVGVCMYYSFKHEQDAFAQQYYSRLMFMKPKSDFNEIMSKGPHLNLENAYNVLLKIKDKDDTLDAINYLGYSRKNFLNLVKYRKKRFLNKIQNVVKRYCEETTELNAEAMINLQNQRLDESDKYGYDIKWGRESLYVF